MILITDGGSTKCDWVLMNSGGKVILRTATAGLNPAVLTSEELQSRISGNEDLMSMAGQVSVLDFYGAGCGTATPVKILTQTLQSLFTNAHVSVYEDTVAAVNAVTTTPGIVCILGTGSNSCYFDGTEIHVIAPSLGYMVMDEASGNYFGKELLRDYFYGMMPEDLALAFGQRFNLDPDQIKIHLYKKPNPNAYLASFAEFIFSSETINSYFYSLLKTGLELFITCRISKFEMAASTPIHFIGSIAHFSEPVIRECLKERDLTLGKILRRPIDGLITYYQSNRMQ